MVNDFSSFSDKILEEYMEDWLNIKDELSHGYAYSLFEFIAELRVRDQIEMLMGNLEDNMQENVRLLDFEIIESVVIYEINKSDWWNFCFPKRATAQLINSVRDVHGEYWANQIVRLS